MTTSPSDYHAYLLRLWREDGQSPWRAELVSPHTGDKHHFANPIDLFHFLANLLSTDEPKESNRP